MTDRRKNGGGDGHYRGEARALDPTENVRDLVDLQSERQDNLRENDRYWQDKLDAVMEHKDALIAARDDQLIAAEREKNDALRLAESRRVDSLRAEDKVATTTALAATQTETRTLATSTETIARTLAASAGRSGLSTPLLVALATMAGGVLLYAFEHLSVK